VPMATQVAEHSGTTNANPIPKPEMSNRLFKVIASKAGRVLFDDRVEAPNPKEAREQMKTLLGFQSLTGVVYAITEIPVDLIQSIVDARIAEALQRIHDGGPPRGVEDMIRPIAGEEVRQQLASLREQLASTSTATIEPAVPVRFDAFAAPTTPTVVESILPQERPMRERRTATVNSNGTDWAKVKRHYLRTRSIKQTAAHFELSPNTVKARIRREGWSHE